MVLGETHEIDNSEKMNNNIIFKTITKGSYFGDVDIIMKTKR